MLPFIHSMSRVSFTLPFVSAFRWRFFFSRVWLVFMDVSMKYWPDSALYEDVQYEIRVCRALLGAGEAFELASRFMRNEINPTPFFQHEYPYTVSVHFFFGACLPFREFLIIY